MRLYISADIEGIAGVVSRDNLAPGRFEYEAARDWMTQAVVSACETAHALGADEIVVSDSHGTGQNIRFERMPPYVQLVRSWPRPLGMMQGIEAGAYDGAFLLGYHAGGDNPAGTLSHTFSGEFIQELRLDGEPTSEAGVSAAIASHFGVPVLLVAGDDVAVRESRERLGDIATACLKTSSGWLSARMLSPAQADLALRAGVADAMSRIGRAKAPPAKGPLLLEIRLRHRFMAEWLSYLDAIERVDAYTIRLRSPDILGVSRFLMFLTSARKAVE
jgi:D-amino peptidase